MHFALLRPIFSRLWCPFYSHSRFQIGCCVVLAIILAMPIAQAAERQVPENDGQIQLSFAPVVQKTAPAVVNIYAQKVTKAVRQHPFMNDPLFQHFFGQELNRFSRPRIQRSLGSGVLIQKNGVIMTNHHVIAGADEIKVVLSSGEEYDADLVGSDEQTDLALLKLRDAPDDLPVIEMGESRSLLVGDLVLAIGNPFGVGQSVTTGIVSATARTAGGINDFNFFIQTDAAINPGNSGGALIDLKGRLVGINTAIYSNSGGSVGIGFSIPVEMVKAVSQSILKTGRIVRPWFGAEGQNLTSDLAKALDIPARHGAHGVVITRVYEDSPADEAGLRAQDVVVSLDGQPVSSMEELRFLLATRAIGSTVKASYWRGGDIRSTELPLVAPPDRPKRAERTLTDRSPFQGLTVANMNPAVAQEYNLPYTPEAVIVLNVAPRSIAARVGWRVGDIIQQINASRVDSVTDLQDLISSNRSGRWRLGVLRDGKQFVFNLR
jgi:serine protease Do